MGSNTTPESTKEALGELLSRADPISTRILNCYSEPASYKENIKKLVANDAPALETCATFLGFTVRSPDGQKLYQNKDILCSRIILKIETLFEMHCDECKELYRNTLDDIPLLTCKACLQGCHNCPEMEKKVDALKQLTDSSLLPPGSVWMCHGCLEKNDLSLCPPKTKSQKVPPSQTPEISLPADISSSSTTPLTVEPASTDNKESDDESEDEYQPANENPATTSEVPPPAPKPTTAKAPAKTTAAPIKVCKAYRERKCPHGMTGKREINGKKCPHPHPPRCNRYCAYGEDKRLGCRRRDTCKYWHPRLCRESELKRQCFNKDCTFTHLRNTARHPTSEIPGNAPRSSSRARERSKPRTVPGSSRQTSTPNMTTSPHFRQPPPPPTPQPTKQNTAPTSCNTDASFLERLLESMKEGMAEQIDLKFKELQKQMVQNSMIRTHCQGNQQCNSVKFPQSCY